MNGFGGYERVKEIHRSGAKSVWTARRAGEGAGAGEASFAIKFLDPAAAGWDKPEARREVAQFLERAAAQKKAANVGNHWAAVIDAGEIDGGAALVTDFYRRNLQAVIQGKVAVDGRNLYHVVRSIVQGLRELHTACGRPHGLLRAGAILIAGRKRIHKSKVVLNSLARSADVADKTSQQIDFPALGQIIYEWVLHLPLGHEQREVQPSDEWSRLGRNGERWRALCADLLNGDGPAAPQSLDELEQRVAALKPPVFTMKRAAVAAAILALLTPASLMAYNRIWLQTPPGRWRTLCENYVNWVEPLATQIADRKLPPTGDPELDELIKRCRKENHWFHPSRILYGDDASTARQVLEDEASFEKLKAKGPQQIQRAQEAASQVERLGDELKKKNVMMAQTVGEVQQRLVKQMPNVRVVQIDELKKDFVLSSDFGRLFINRVAALPMLQRLAAQLKVLQEETGIIQSDQVASKEPLLKQFAAFQDAEVSRSPQVANLAALSERLKTLQSLASEIHTAIDGPWSAQGRPQTAIASSGAEAYRQWIARVTQPIPDSYYQQWEAQNRQGVLNARKSLTEMENSQSDQPTPQEIAAAGKQLQALAQRLSDDRKNKLVQAAEPQVAQTLKDYVAKIESVSKLYAVWQDNQDHVFKHPALAQVWQDLGKRGAPNRVMLKTALEQMDDAAPVKQKPEGRPDWEQGLWSAYESARNKMLDDAARTIRSGGPSSWSGVSAQVVTAMKSLFIAAEQLTVHCGGIDRLWSQFRTADETTPSLLKLHQDAEKVLAAAGELRPPIEPLLNRAARIVNVAGLDRAALSAAAVKESDPQVRWAVWKRLLKSVADWPATEEDLDREQKLSASLKASLREKVADAARKEELLREFHAGGITKLTHYVSAQIAARGESAHTHLAAVVGKLSDFDDLKLAEFAPKDHFNLALGRLHEGMSQTNLEDTPAKGLIETFKNEVKLIGDPAVQANYQELLKLFDSASQRSATPPPDRPPLFPGWNRDERNKIQTIVYTLGDPNQPKPRHILRFIKLSDPGDNGLAPFLCTTEVSLRLLIDVWSSAQWADFGTLLPEYTRKGPLVWDWSGADSRLQPAHWLKVEGGVDEGFAVRGVQIKTVEQCYLPGEMPADPDADTPVQHIPVAVAQKIAAILGCRLASFDEWKAARDRIHPQNPGQNLRDRSWKRVWDHLTGFSSTQVANLQDTYEGRLSSEVLFDASSIAPDDDKHVWFSQVDTTGDNAFHDLVGNVAEWVTEKNVTDKSVTGKNAVGIVGGSALSSPLEQNYQSFATVQKSDPAAYSDVGFRLALDETVPMIAVAVRAELNKYYLRP